MAILLRDVPEGTRSASQRVSQSARTEKISTSDHNLSSKGFCFSSNKSLIVIGPENLRPECKSRALLLGHLPVKYNDKLNSTLLLLRTTFTYPAIKSL